MPGQHTFWRHTTNNGTGSFDDRYSLDCTGLGKQAAVLWLLLSIDRKPEGDQSYRLDDLFGLSRVEPEEEDEDDEEREDWQETKSRVTGTLNRFLDTLDGLDANERYDAVADEIDRLAEDEDVSFLWNLVRLVYRDEDYAGNKRRMLRRLSRKLGFENSVFPALENAAKAFDAIKKEREALTASDRPYREVAAALAELERKEKETLDSLKELGVVTPEDGESGEAASGEDTIVDKLGDAAVEIIRGVTDGIEGILDGFTSAITRLM